MKTCCLKLIFITALILQLALPACTITRNKCNELYPPVVAQTVDTFLQVRETWLHDTTYLPADLSEMDFYFEADSNNNVQVIQQQAKKGKRSSIDYTLQRTNKVLKASFDCKCDSLRIYHLFKSTDTSLLVNKSQTKIHTVQVPVNLSWWQNTKLAWGGYALGADLLVLLLLLIYAAWRIFKVATPQGAALTAFDTGINQLMKFFKK